MFTFEQFHILSEMSMPDKKKMIIDLLGDLDDSQMDKILTIIAEPKIDQLLEDINKKKNIAFSKNDLRLIKNNVLDAPGSTEEKLDFLQTCLDSGHIDMGAILRMGTANVVNIERQVQGNRILKHIFTRLGGKGGGGFNLNSGSAVGPGEGFFVLVCDGVTKGKVGDLMYNGGDVELKANSARWHSARVQYGSVREMFSIAHSELKTKVSLDEFKKLVDFRANKFVNVKTLKALGVSKEDLGKAIAKGLAKVFPNTADFKYIVKGDWVGDSIKWRAAYAYTIASVYQKSDGWEYIVQYNYAKKTLFAMKNPEAVYKGIISGKLKSSATTDGNMHGGSDSRSVSPNFDVGK
jgi:hypothetical protein